MLSGVAANYIRLICRGHSDWRKRRVRHLLGGLAQRSRHSPSTLPLRLPQKVFSSFTYYKLYQQNTSWVYLSVSNVLLSIFLAASTSGLTWTEVVPNIHLIERLGFGFLNPFFEWGSFKKKNYVVDYGISFFGFSLFWWLTVISLSKCTRRRRKKRIALECATAERNNQMWICECMWINAWMIFNG